MSYETAPATILLATNCCCCGRPLVDSVSVEYGIGPECREHLNIVSSEPSPETRREANKLTYAAAIASQLGKIAQVRIIAQQLKDLGFTVLSDKIQERFTRSEQNATITILEQGQFLYVKTPYKRSAPGAFHNAWRSIPGRWWDGANQTNVVPVQAKRQVYALLCRFFPGSYGLGPLGPFRLPSKSPSPS